jgi:hypothetical protein
MPKISVLAQLYWEFPKCKGGPNTVSSQDESPPPPKKIKKNSFYTGVLQKKNYFKNGSARRKKLQNIAIDVHGGRGQKEILF